MLAYELWGMIASIYRILKLGKYPKVQNQVILALRQSMEFLEKCNNFIWWSKRIPSIGLCSSNSAREVILLLEVKHIPRDLFRSRPPWQAADMIICFLLRVWHRPLSLILGWRYPLNRKLDSFCYLASW